jgi:predicted secreted hydrolase
VTISERAAAALLAALLAPGPAAGPPGDPPGTAAAIADPDAAPGGWAAAGPDRAWSFPADHWAHREFRTEWWYFTGHLSCADDPGRRFAYQFTLFRVGLLREPPRLDSDWSTGTLIMGHAAIADLEAGAHRFSDLLYRETPRLGEFGRHPDPVIAWVRPPPGTGSLWRLRHVGEGFELEMRDEARGMRLRLATVPLKPLVLQGPNGWSRKGEGPGAVSHYYSFTRLYTAGRLRAGPAECGAEGTSWMDHEFSSGQLLPQQVGWDWFGLRLDDGRDLMLYLMRRADGSVDYRFANLVDPAGRVAPLAEEDWSLRAVASWRSAETGTVYPARWTLEVPDAGLDMEIVPALADQENRGRVRGAPRYYEGAVEVRGRDGAILGRGHVELTGYGENNRPPV